MATIGRITGFEVAVNKDGDTQSLLLQVEMTEEDDIQTVELFRHAGVDYNPPNDSTPVIIPVTESLQIAVAVDDGITPTTDPGEYEIYSSDGTTKQATIKLDVPGTVKINGGGRQAARKDDTVITSGGPTGTDPAWYTWLAAVGTATGVGPPPTTITSKITTGSPSVELPND
jgi:hypothetical protein